MDAFPPKYKDNIYIYIHILHTKYINNIYFPEIKLEEYDRKRCAVVLELSISLK